MIRVLLVFGTRPEAIKMAPVYRVLAANPKWFDCRVCVTAQHREMLDQVLSMFGIPCDHDLDVMTKNQSLTEITNRVVAGVGLYLDQERFDHVLVHGDTTTTFAAGLAAFYRKVPVGHVEAGLRTGNRYSPYPEEMNRKLTTAIATTHFAPTPQSRSNLLRENVELQDIIVTGNTAIDALQAAVALPHLSGMRSLFSKGSYGLLVTAHRRENFGEGIERISRALRTLALERPEIEIIYPVHYNPNIREPVRRILSGVRNVKLIDPVEYDAFVRLMSDCRLILTDSGGVQEEAPSLGKPVLVLRDCTERPEAVEAGTVRLVGTDEHDILETTRLLLDDKNTYDRMAKAINPYGDGRAAPRIAAALLRLHNIENDLTRDAEEFGP